MEGERLVDLSSLHRGHVVHLVLAQLVGHLNVSQCLRRLCLSISSITFSFSLFLSLYFSLSFSLSFSFSCLHLLRGRAGRQLAVRRPLLLASFALTREKEVLLKMESLISRKPSLFLTLRNCFRAKTPSSLKTAQ